MFYTGELTIHIAKLEWNGMVFKLTDISMGKFVLGFNLITDSINQN